MKVRSPNNPLRRILDERARAPLDGQVYVKGGWVDRRSTVPTDGGVEALVRFADQCWQKNIQLQRQVLELKDERRGPDATAI